MTNLNSLQDTGALEDIYQEQETELLVVRYVVL